MHVISSNQRGAIAVISLMIIASFALAVITTVSLTSMNVFRGADAGIDTDQTFYAAEAGINEGLYELNIDPSPHEFCLGFDAITVNCDDAAIRDKVRVTITANGYNRTITSVAQDASGKERTLHIEVTTSSISVPLQYAVHSGRGGFILDNGAQVKGPIYSNGNIEGSNTSLITGEVQVANEPTPSPKQESHPLPYSIAQDAAHLRVAQQIVPPVTERLTKVSLYIQRSSNQQLPELPGTPYQVKIVRDIAGSPDLTQVVAQQQISIPRDIDWVPITFTPAPLLTSGQPYWIVVGATAQTNATRYIIWDYNDNPDTYADGAAKYFDNTTGTWNTIAGDFSFQTLLGIGDTFVKDGTVNGDITAHSIINVSGTGSRTSGAGVNPPRVDYPITDADINDWKSGAQAGGELNCGPGSACTKDANGDVTITANMSIGPNVVHGNLNINSGVSITVLGNLYVEKNITFNPPAGATMIVGPANTPAARVVVAEGQIKIKNNDILSGSGHVRSFLLMVSLDDYLTSGEIAISPSNNSSSVLFFAPKGFVEMANGTFLNSATAYIIHLENAIIEYNENLSGFTVPDPTPAPIVIIPGQGWEEQ
ncbi:MAG: hypothetical protein HZC01_04175 [Candidatus Kerfeldbacteria bacterium]|nr:hypothetical protein [Candidatus Kerfeldbacteria bacterium]